MLDQPSSKPNSSMYNQMLESANEIYSDYLKCGENVIEVHKKQSLKKLEQVIERVKKEDFGINQNQATNSLIFADKNTISYVNIHSESDERFSFGLFFIPKGGFLPLHDHPNMFVFSKILMGQVKRLSFSLENRSIQFEYPKHSIQQQMLINKESQQKNSQSDISKEEGSSLSMNKNDNGSEFSISEFKKVIEENNKKFEKISAHLDSEEILNEGFIDELDPIHKNLHYIEAIEDCVFFDVLLPHYDLNSRHCNYYSIEQKPDKTTGKAILQVSKQPQNQGKVQYFSIDKSCNYFN